MTPPPIADANLRLALLDELRDDPDWVEDLEEAYEQARQAHPDWRSWEELSEDTYEPNPDLEAFVRALPLEVDKLGTLTSLTLDGDRDVYAWLGGETWYEDEELFVTRDLTGLERCEALEYLNIGQGLHQGCSLRPLRGMTKLRELWLCALGGYRDIETLLELPALEKIEIGNVATSDERETWKRVLAQWNARHQTRG